MDTLVFISQIILIAMFAFLAGMKFLGTKATIQHWNDYRYPLWFMYLTAALEVMGMMGVLAGIWYPVLLRYAAALLVLLMLGAIHAHLFRARHKPVMAINALLMLVLSVFLIVVQL
ncbi:DoxX family protein [Brevibacillus humidisoli]|uniref:DoxX family protein n=1 Tax=Brevibacillus humidisoli TaxID=2895522 RepID=UPI001E3F075B|nr:DoxX family protein [Brevibacillus humidisoli]UFJ39548.1 DoxX family protein [Brevibacillus humidisoli]